MCTGRVQQGPAVEAATGGATGLAAAAAATAAVATTAAAATGATATATAAATAAAAATAVAATAAAATTSAAATAAAAATATGAAATADAAATVTTSKWHASMGVGARRGDSTSEPRRSHYRADGPFHLVLRSRVPPPPVLPQPPESSLTVFHDPLFNYLCASRPVVSRVLSMLVTHPSAPPLSVLAPVTTIAGFSSSHCLDYAAHLLRRPIYGLRQAPREWHNTRRTTLSALDFFPSSADPSLFVRRGSTPFFVLVYVDDLVFANPDRRALASVKEELQTRPTCTDLGELQRYLGLLITWDSAARTITLTQSHMVEQILTLLCFPFSKVQLAPLALDHGLTAPPSDKPFESNGPYPELVGCLMYLMTCTRPGLAYPLSVLARFLARGRHRPSHWYAAKRVAKYVASTSSMGLVLGGKQPVTLTAFPNSSWADDAESLRSTQGYCFSLGTGAVSWRSTRVSPVSSSSYEAEAYVAAMATLELRWLSFLLTDLGEWPRSPPVLFANNRSAVLLCKEPRLVGKAKHIQLCYFLLRELQQRGQARVVRMVSKANTADIFTKALPPCDH
ncbi:unnamed protein product [Closterium sp. NIES-54]